MIIIIWTSLLQRAGQILDVVVTDTRTNIGRHFYRHQDKYWTSLLDTRTNIGRHCYRHQDQYWTSLLQTPEPILDVIFTDARTNTGRHCSEQQYQYWKSSLQTTEPMHLKSLLPIPGPALNFANHNNLTTLKALPTGPILEVIAANNWTSTLEVIVANTGTSTGLCKAQPDHSPNINHCTSSLVCLCHS